LKAGIWLRVYPAGKRMLERLLKNSSKTVGKQACSSFPTSDVFRWQSKQLWRVLVGPDGCWLVLAGAGCSWRVLTVLRRTILQTFILYTTR
jgi:hypothetical protein